MRYARTLLLAVCATAALMIVMAALWAAPPKGPSATVPNPNVSVPNPNVTVPNPSGGPPVVSHNLGSVNQGGQFVGPGTRWWFRRYGPFGYGYGYGYGEGYRYNRNYVVAQKRGADVTWSVYTMTHDVYTQTQLLRTEADNVSQTNAQLKAEIADLRKQESALKAELAREKEEALRKVIADKLAGVESAIRDRELAIRPVVKWVVAGPFTARQLDDYLVRVEREAWETRRKAGLLPTTAPPAAPAPPARTY